MSAILGMFIVTAPFIVGLMIGASGDSIFVWTVLGSLPILIGMMAQQIRGRSVVAWWLLSLLAISFKYRFVMRVSACLLALIRRRTSGSVHG